jgi:BetI-type transcriptional repressor, C-terminal
MSAESARNPTIAKITSRSERGVRELLNRLVREGQERGQVDPGLDPDSVAAVVHSIIFGLNLLGAVRDPTFDVKAASDMLNLLIDCRANLATSATARSKTADQYDGNTGDEFGCASARRFDGAARSILTVARCGFAVRFERPGMLLLSTSP